MAPAALAASASYIGDAGCAATPVAKSRSLAHWYADSALALPHARNR
jgi:hypothetical protein